jgi:hypothetical protein
LGVVVGLVGGAWWSSASPGAAGLGVVVGLVGGTWRPAAAPC